MLEVARKTMFDDVRAINMVEFVRANDMVEVVRGSRLVSAAVTSCFLVVVKVLQLG